MRFCFVILHYMTAFDTIECIESIKLLNTVCQIVVVDNASNNGSIETIEEKYSEDKNIYIIKINLILVLRQEIMSDINMLERFSMRIL